MVVTLKTKALPSTTSPAFGLVIVPLNLISLAAAATTLLLLLETLVELILALPFAFVLAVETKEDVIVGVVDIVAIIEAWQVTLFCVLGLRQLHCQPVSMAETLSFKTLGAAQRFSLGAFENFPLLAEPQTETACVVLVTALSVVIVPAEEVTGVLIALLAALLALPLLTTRLLALVKLTTFFAAATVPFCRLNKKLPAKKTDPKIKPEPITKRIPCLCFLIIFLFFIFINQIIDLY